MKHLKYILASLTTIISMLAEAQGNITGRVIDEQSQPIPFVNVVLLNRADSAFIMGTVTKDEGTFTIETAQGCYGYYLAICCRELVASEDVTKEV